MRVSEPSLWPVARRSPSGDGKKERTTGGYRGQTHNEAVVSSDFFGRFKLVRIKKTNKKGRKQCLGVDHGFNFI